MTGEQMRDLRLSVGMMAKELAKMLEISVQTISRYERDKRPIPKHVEYAVRWVCRDTTPGQKLLIALREALEHARGQ